MFIIKMIPLMIYVALNKTKSKGLGKLHTYCISALSVLFIIHLMQLGVIMYYLNIVNANTKISQNNYTSIDGSIIWVIIILGYLGLWGLLSHLYPKKTFVKWYSENKEKRILRYSSLIVLVYYFFNIALLFMMCYYLLKK